MENKYTDFGFTRVRSKDKSNLVKNLFENVSPKYDLMNDFMSFGIHRVWKDFMLDWLAPKRGQSLIDVAGGTGDIALDFIKRAKDKNINEVYFDRGQYKYHGRVRAFAETLRKNGLKF